MSFGRTFTWLFVVMSFVGAPSPAAAKTLIDYFQPTPIVCPLTSSTWGAAGVLPRDTCNGLEDATNKQWQYWDGKILKGADGKFHMYAGEWPQNKGFADWPQSVIVEAVSNGTVIGSYIPTTTTPFTGKEQNVTGMVLNDGSYALLDSPGNIYTSTSLADPWTSAGTIKITNGSTTSTASTEKNQTVWPNADGSFLIINRTFQDMVSANNILGPYVVKATIGLQSQGYEDPVVWCSGGQYHLVANDYNARKANHFTSTDGINNWKNMGLAYDPTADFIRYTDGTINHWYKIERAGVYLENGHVAAFSFAVIDVDKNSDVANDTHGSKIVVVPFDGVAFDRDNPGPGSAACPADSGGPADAGQAGGSGGSDGGLGTGGTTGAGGKSGTGGTPGRGGAAGAGGRTGLGGSIGMGGTPGTGGSVESGGVTAPGGAAGGGLGTGGRTGVGGMAGGATGGGAPGTSGSIAETGGGISTGAAMAPGGSSGGSGAGNTGPAEAGGSSASGGTPESGGAGGAATAAVATQAGSGCSCRISDGHAAGYPGLALFALLMVALRRRSRPRAPVRAIPPSDCRDEPKSA
jgi:MYXO-CTERM domain-containing protein